MRRLNAAILLVLLLLAACTGPGQVNKTQIDQAAEAFAARFSTEESSIVLVRTVREGPWWESTLQIDDATQIVLFFSPVTGELAGIECPETGYQSIEVFEAGGADGSGCWTPLVQAEPTAPLASVAYEPSFEPAPCPFPLPQDWPEELVECGYLVVPEHRGDANSPVIRLAAAIFRHPSGEPEPDPIVYLVGGPGGSILEIVSSQGFATQFAPMLDANRDIILLDQRGVGYSQPALDCPEFVELYLDALDFQVDGQEIDAQERLARKIDSAQACSRQLEEMANLAAYNTAENAADVADLRHALGYDQVNLWGGSYGARLALEVLRSHPEGIRSAMLEATYPPETDLFRETPADFDRALSRLVEACAAEEACDAAYPDLRAVLLDTVDALNQQPASIQVPHPLTGQSYPLTISGDVLLELIFRALYSAEMRPVLPQAIYEASQGMFDRLLLIAAQDLWRQDIRSWGMYFSVLCHEEIPFSSPEAFEEALANYPEFAGFFRGFEVGGLTYGVCPGWESGQAGPVANEPVRSAVPTLVLAGEYDPIAPPAWGEQVASSLANGYYFLYPGMAHGGSSTACQQQMMLAFVEDPTKPPDDSCIDEMAVAPFTIPGEGTAVELEPFTSETFGFSGLRPVGWSELGPGVYNRGQGPDDVARLIQQAAPGATVEQLKTALSGQLGLDSLPESSETLDTPAFTWELIQVELDVPLVGQILVHLALAEDDQAAYIVLLQATADEAPALYEALFVPALEALALPGAEAEEGVYRHPAGLFSAPIPTNWTVEQNEGFATLTSPDGEVVVHLLALEADDLEEATSEGWRVVDPEFDLPVAEVIDEPVTNGAERAITVVYDTGEDEAIIIGGGWLYDGIAYLELFETTLEPLQKRAYQLATISTGYEIAALEESDLAAIELAPLEEVLPELEAYIEEKMDQLEVPGAAVAITQGGQMVYAKGFGVRDLESQEPVTPETLMLIGSSTKPMTTLLMAQLVDRGDFAWDTPVVEVLPTFRVADEAVTDEITMRNLVCACSGVPRRDLEWLFNADELSAEDIVGSLADFEFFTDFGEAFQYSNQMVASGGYLATLAAGGEYGRLGDDYVGLMQEQVFDPIGMPSTTFDFDAAQAGDNVATPYAQTPTGETVVVPREVEETLPPVAPAGALWSNLLDVSRFLVTALNQGVTPDGERIVSAENLAVTWEPQVDITADMSYGLGWIVEDYKGIPVISHAGNTFGFTSEQAFLPQHDLTISVLTNQRASALGQVIRYRLLELLFQQEPQIDQQLSFTVDMLQEISDQKRKTIQDEVQLEAVEPFLGTYDSDALGQMTLSWADGQLIMDVGEFEIDVRAYMNDEGEISYEAYTPSAVSGMPVALEQGDDGQPRVVFGLGVMEYTYEKAD